MTNILSIPVIKELKVIFLKISEEKEEHTISNIFTDSTIKDIQNKIFCESGVKPYEQYLFFKSAIDEYFFECLDNIFNSRSILSTKTLLSNLSKILSENDINKFQKDLKKKKIK